MKLPLSIAPPRVVLTVGLCLATRCLSLGEPGTVIWTQATGDAVLSSPALGPDGTVYFGSYDQRLYALNPTNGAIRWSFPVSPQRPSEASYIFSSPAVAEDGTIYFGTENRNFHGSRATGDFYALNANGTLKWKVSFDDAIYSDPAIGSDGTIYFGCFDTNLYAYEPSGMQKWKFLAGDQIYSDPAIALNGTIYFGCDDGNLYALNSTGTLKWTFQTGGPITTSPVIGSDGTIYVGSTRSQKLFAVNSDGTLQWEFLTGGQVNSSPALGSDGGIYFGSDDNKLYALNSNGTLKWEYPTGGSVASSPALAADGMIYVGSYDGALHAVSSLGLKAWTFPTTNYIYASPVIGADGTIFITSADYNAYAVRGSAGLARTAWPMFRQNPMHTGRQSPPLSNTPPMISFIADQMTLEDTAAGPITFTVDDAETPVDNLSVVGSSSNLTLLPNSNIVLTPNGTDYSATLTPAQDQHGTTTIHITVTDGDGASTTTNFVLTVTQVNDPPNLAPVPDQTIDEASTFTLFMMASDPDSTSDTLAFALLSGPARASLQAATGILAWIPGEADGPANHTFVISVNDSGSLSLSATQSFTVAVREVNSAPALAAIPNYTVHAGSIVSFTAQANDGDAPANVLMFALTEGPPGATIHPETGVFTWEASNTYANTTVPVTLSVTDNGLPPLSDSHGFTVTLFPPPRIDSLRVNDAEIVITWSAIAGTRYRMQRKSDLLAGTWTDWPEEILATGSIASWSGTLGSTNQEFFRIIATP